MSTDRELLELAAKAAGAIWSDYPQSHIPDEWLVGHPDGLWRPWRPLTDDGDALRLAVRLGMSFGFVLETGGMAHWGPVTYTQAQQQIDDLQCGRGYSGPMETHGKDPEAATRRAIVRAAAEIGRNMP